VIVEDVTARKAEQKAIQEAHATNESLIAAIPDMLFQLDGEMHIVRYHAPSDDVLSMPPRVFWGVASTPHCRPRWRGALQRQPWRRRAAVVFSASNTHRAGRASVISRRASRRSAQAEVSR
jgi:PAS domain-containing protein